MNFLCQSGMFFLHVFITKAWDSTLADERFGVMAPTVLASDRPLSESTDAGGPPKRVGSNEASIFFLLAMLDFGTVKQTLCFILSKQNQRKVTTT